MNDGSRDETRIPVIYGGVVQILYDRIVGPVKGYDKELQEAFNPKEKP